MSRIVDAIIANMAASPRDWDIDSFRVRNSKLGVRVWTANHRYGLEVTGPSILIGGVTPASSFFAWAIPWRRKLWNACQELALARLRCGEGG